SSSAQNLSIGEYERQVMSYSLELKIAMNQSDKSQESVSFMKLLRLPTLAASGSYEHNFRREEGVRYWYFNLQPQITQTLYAGGEVGAKVKLSELEQEVALCDVEFTALEVRYASDYAFWSLVAAERYRDAMREYVKIITSLKSVVDRRFEEGYISKNDVLMIASRLSEAEYELVSSEEAYRVALHNLNTLRGYNADAEVAPQRGNEDEATPLERVDIGEIIKRRPDYESMLISKEMSSVSTRIVKASYMPQLNLGVRSVYQSLQSKSADKTRIDGGAFLQLTMPIFHFGARKKAIQVSERDEVYYDLSTKLLHDDITREETNGWTTLQQSYAQLVAAKKSLEIAGESLTISTYSYSEGLAIILDVMQAQISWIQVYSNSIDSEFNYLVARSLYKKITAMD
ncbi:MAG: TolC family protein, partial [Rikenellaceae bacterium]